MNWDEEICDELRAIRSTIWTVYQGTLIYIVAMCAPLSLFWMLNILMKVVLYFLLNALGKLLRIIHQDMIDLE